MTNNAPAPPAGASSAAVYIAPNRQQLIGVRTGVVARQKTGGVIRTVGTLAYDETRLAHINVKTVGWVDQVFVNYTGKTVRRGQPLFSVYSPDLVSAQSEFLIAVRAKQRLGAAAPAESVDAADALMFAARERLKRRWDISDADLKGIEARGTPAKTTVVSSPFEGVVVERNAFAGKYVTPEMSTFKLADLSTLWVIGQAFESDAAVVRVGTELEVELPYEPAMKPLTARIDFVYPDVDPITRRVRFRASLANADRSLKPETYVTVAIRGAASQQLMVPREAVIDTGTRRYVLLALDGGFFDPRDVKLGTATADGFAVLSGLAEGDRVVTSAQFLVDSETNLMAAMQSMAMSMPGMNMGSGKGQTAPATPATPVTPATSNAPPHQDHGGM